MNRSHLVLALSSTLLALPLLAGSCSVDKAGGAPKKQVSTFDPNAKDSDGGSGSSGASSGDGGGLASGDAAAFEMPRDIKNAAQALQVLIVAYDTEAKEGEVGKTLGSTPPVKAFAADVVEEAKAGKARIRQAAANKSLTPASSFLTDRMKFESQSSISHLKNIFKDMFNETWANRRIDAASNLLRLIDDELTPVLADDDDLKQELATTRDETEKRLARAEALRSGILAGPGNSDGMFPEPDEPQPQPQRQQQQQQPQQQQQQQQPQQQQQQQQPQQDGGGAAAAPPADPQRQALRLARVRR